MILSETYTIEWITSLKQKLGKRIDPKLIEKVIYALTLQGNITIFQDNSINHSDLFAPKVPHKSGFLFF
jgi:hypothetical protein